jgi:site-specific recombinase XerD
MASRLDDLGRSFARHLRAEGRAERTVVIYGQAVRYFAAWLVESDRSPTVDELSRAAVRAWLASLTDRGQEPGTIRTRHLSLGRFCKWLVDEGEITANPMTGLRLPTPTDKPVPVLSDRELAGLIKACGGKTLADRRDEAFIRILLDTGVRVSEACAMTVEGTDLDRQSAVIRGKGNKVRAVYFGARTARAVDRYSRLRAASRWSHLDALWLSQRGALSTDGARELVRVRAQRAGLEHIHPHQLRHTFAHDFLSAGGQERDLMRLAGWSSPEMLSRYGASAADQRAKDAAQRMRRGDRV